jgi:KipI family sensor histidine kinase inhibitor
MAGQWPRVSRLGEETWLVELEPRLDPRINAEVHRLARAVAASGTRGVRDVVPGMSSLAIHVDGDYSNEQEIEDLVQRLLSVHEEEPAGGTLHEIPVCYEPPYAIDIADVAERCHCRINDVIGWHAATEYRVFMIGFLPGFPYLGVLNPRLVLPRRDVPRAIVPGGSVAIAGEQTGIYPSQSPGGWHVIGRTPTRLFDPFATPPGRLSPGDRVRFVPMSADGFAQQASSTVPEGSR